MKLNNVSLLRLDEDSFNKTKTGLFKVIQGNKYDKYSRIAHIDIPSDTTVYKKDDKVVFFHMILDYRTTDFQYHPQATVKNHCIATDNDIVGYFEGEELKSHNKIICKKTTTTEENFLETKTIKHRNILEVVFSPFKSVKKGDIVTTRKYGGYEVEELNRVFLEEKDCILVNGEPREGYHVIKKLHAKDYREQSGILLNDNEYYKYLGEDKDGNKVQFVGRKTRSFEDGDSRYFLVQDKDIFGYAIN